jgi:alkylation response protein AidB-like acyl-CoA dehydrogenase
MDLTMYQVPAADDLEEPPSAMQVRFTEEQELLRRSAGEVLDRECPMQLVRDMLDDPLGVDDALWKQLCGLGWTGLALPEESGGAGLGLLELSLLLEEMGRRLLPGPFTRRATLAVLEEGGSWALEAIALPARRRGEGFVLSGLKRFVPDAQSADLLIVPARTGSAEGDVTLFLVETRAPGVSVHPVAFLDGTRKLADVRFENVEVAGESALGAVDGGAPLLQDILDHAKVALCAEMCGGAARVLELSVAYARSREQFGRPIGSFQAIQHKCADMFVQVEGARSATYYAAWCLDARTPDAHLAACMAKAFCSDAYRSVAGEGIQIHGGLGFTWEQDLHLYYKRAKASEVAFGDAIWNREEVARMVVDGGG